MPSITTRRKRRPALTIPQGVAQGAGPPPSPAHAPYGTYALPATAPAPNWAAPPSTSDPYAHAHARPSSTTRSPRLAGASPTAARYAPYPSGSAVHRRLPSYERDHAPYDSAMGVPPALAPLRSGGRHSPASRGGGLNLPPISAMDAMHGMDDAAAVLRRLRLDDEPPRVPSGPSSYT